MSEIDLLEANHKLSEKLDKLKGVEFELQMAREKIAQQQRAINDLTKAKLKINSVRVIKDDGVRYVRYVMRITNTFETANGIVVEGRL
jgi:multidrug resistance efflux pump